MLERGEEVVLTYPRSTHIRLFRPDQTARRLLLVQDVRDLVAEPLSVMDVLRRPYLLRSRWLIRAWEPEACQWRQFYLGSSAEFSAPAVLRVGIYEPGATKPSKLIGRGFEATPEDRKVLLRALLAWKDYDLGEASLRVFADDLRVRRSG